MTDVLSRTHTIIHDPHILGGEPILAGTRVPVRAVVQLSRLYPDVRDLLDALPTLDAEDVRVALTYYTGHRGEVERWIAYDAAADDEPLP